MPRYKATNKQIYDYVLEHYGIKVGGNEITDAKELAGFKPPMAHNRINPNQRSTYSPKASIDAIHAAFRHFGMI